MKFHTKRKHMIDIIFPVSLFFLFALSAFTILLLAARIYQSTTEYAVMNDTARTSLAYVSEKIHQNDVSGCVEITELDGTEALRLEQNYEGGSYYTYIYVYEDTLRELFVKKDAEANPAFGTKILEVRDFSMEQKEENLLQFTCTDRSGQKESVFVAVRSE